MLLPCLKFNSHPIPASTSPFRIALGCFGSTVDLCLAAAFYITSCVDVLGGEPAVKPISEQVEEGANRQCPGLCTSLISLAPDLSHCNAIWQKGQSTLISNQDPGFKKLIPSSVPPPVLRAWCSTPPQPQPQP